MYVPNSYVPICWGHGIAKGLCVMLWMIWICYEVLNLWDDYMTCPHLVLVVNMGWLVNPNRVCNDVYLMLLEFKHLQCSHISPWRLIRLKSYVFSLYENGGDMHIFSRSKWRTYLLLSARIVFLNYFTYSTYAIVNHLLANSPIFECVSFSCVL